MRYRGDIRELCELAPPDLAVVTSVGVAHLETMGSLENIAREKSDLLAHMKPGGIAVLNLDDELVAAMFSTEPIVSRCATPTEVTTARWGGASSHNSRMSPR